MLTRFRLIAPAAAAAVAVVGAVAAVGSPAAVPSVPSIYVDYNSPTCTFTMSVDGGIALTSATAPGPTLPPGTYALELSMPNPSSGYVPCVKPVFTLTGPGVSSVIEFRGEELHYEGLTTLQPSSTYVAQDENSPGSTRKVFTTAASGSNSVLLGSSGGAQSGGTTGSVVGDVVGSAVVRYRGKLAATVTTAGKATLRLGGRSVGSLRAGRYDIKVDDTTARAGFFVQQGTRKAVIVTTLAFVGKRTRRVTLAPGKWTFFSKVGRPAKFTVVG